VVQRITRAIRRQDEFRSPVRSALHARAYGISRSGRRAPVSAGV